jgi:hypothetical protein
MVWLSVESLEVWSPWRRRQRPVEQHELVPGNEKEWLLRQIRTTYRGAKHGVIFTLANEGLGRSGDIWVVAMTGCGQGYKADPVVQAVEMSIRI